MGGDQAIRDFEALGALRDEIKKKMLDCYRIHEDAKRTFASVRKDYVEQYSGELKIDAERRADSDPLVTKAKADVAFYRDEGMFYIAMLNILK